MRTIRNVRIRFMDREVECLALFDSGSGVTMLDVISLKIALAPLDKGSPGCLSFTGSLVCI
ncbi:hypothetical protein Igag_1873 [Ignisphaera aggregans DSM 17230]|uniref:Uncharacterized protein n=1 Tax=Ignisphaera aggregans (strain DSM 17230 / JCM 13409 / AQ1.S1) TaxID=583356 RepID=E0ST07_IGNAA|nr:hypothetical protein Igag_1873 [Ignisphaera aggregans DSM 17230]